MNELFAFHENDKTPCNSIVNHFFSQFGAVFSYVIDIEF